MKISYKDISVIRFSKTLFFKASGISSNVIFELMLILHNSDKLFSTVNDNSYNILYFK